jgi:hypothetical protein
MGDQKASGPGAASAPGEGQADPMAAQRAAAAEAWKRLQGPKKDDGTAQADASAQSSASPAVPSADEPAPPQPGFGQPGSQTYESGETAGGGTNGAPTQPEPWAARQAANQAAQSNGSPVPFEDLPAHGFFPGLWGTIRMILTKPSEFFKRMPAHGGMGKPLAFHLLLAEFMVLCQYVWSMAGIGATAEYLGKPELMDMGLGVAGAAPIALFLIYPLLLVLRLMVMTGVIHLLLLTLKAGGAGAEATFRVLCYSAAPLLLGVIPGVGPLIGGVWSIGLTIIGLREAHRTRISSAMFAVLVPILLMLAAVIGLLQGMVHGGA